MTLSERVQEHAFRRRWLILVVLCVSLLVIVLDNSILNVAIPTIVRELDASNSQVQWMVDSYTLVFAGLLLTMGSLGDRYGRRGALQIGFLVFGLGSLASALATSADQLIATRAFMGIGGALIMPATLSIITNVFPAQERGRAIGVWAGTAGVGVALGPLTGGFLLEHFYWGSIFLVNLPIVVLGLIAGFFLIPTSKDPSAPRLDPIGALLSIAGLTALLYAIIEAPNSGWTSPSTLTTFALGAGLLLVFGWWELNSDHPMLDLRFFENPRFSAANAAITLTFFAMFGSIFLLTQYLQFTLGYTPLEAGIRMLPYAITMMVVAPTSARVVERVGSKTTVATGLFLVTLALLLMTMLQVDTAYIDIAWRMVIMAAGLGLVMAPATDSVMGSLPLAKAGVGSAVNDTTRQVGGAMGVAIIGSVLSSVYGAKVADWFVSRPAPAGAKEAAKNSLGGAIAVADKLKGAKIAGADALAHGLTSTANQAFVDALHAGLFVAAAATFVGVLVVAKWLPAAARGADVRGQAAEFTAEHAADGQHPAPEPAPAPAGAPSGRPAPAPAAVPAMKAAPPARAKPAAAKAPAKKAATKAESPTANAPANAPVKKTPAKKAAPRKARAKKAPAKVSEAANGAAAQKAALDGDGSANVEGSPNGAAAQQTPATADGSANGATPKPAVAPGESSEVGTP